MKEHENIKPMNEDFYINLIYKKLDECISEPEGKQLKEWLELNEENKKTFTAIQLSWQNFDRVEIPNFNIQNEFKELESKLPTHNVRKILSFKTITIAAGFILLMGISVNQLFFNELKTWKTLASNSEIEVFRLPDNSNIILRQNSKLQYASDFISNRNVSLKGTAFFDVTKNPELPFTINTEIGDIKVLGTSFSVSSEQDILNVHVKTGKVEVTIEDQNIILNPHEKIEFVKDQNKLLAKIMAQYPSDNWDSQIFIFHNANLESVVEELSKEFNIDIKIPSTAKNCQVTSTFKKMEIQQILKNIAVLLNGTLVAIDEKEFELKDVQCE